METVRLIRKKHKEVKEIKEERVVVPIKKDGVFYDKAADEVLLDVKDDTEICQEWDGKAIWLNPDYEWRLVFLEGDGRPPFPYLIALKNMRGKKL